MQNDTFKKFKIDNFSWLKKPVQLKIKNAFITFNKSNLDIIVLIRYKVQTKIWLFLTV